jgi:hypothetical protein
VQGDCLLRTLRCQQRSRVCHLPPTVLHANSLSHTTYPVKL